ncbi:hypothetical protein [Pseudoroseicyclus aestuarii]|nr:hypothetical protein [Pseudoroseicyclus aestuarii]
MNTRNPVARRLYLSGGWEDTGRTFTGASAEPQHIMRLDLRG